MKKKKIYSFILVFYYLFFQAQSILLVEDAIKIGIENNYSILMGKNEKQIIHQQNNLGNAGMAPQLSFNSNINFANLNSYQEFTNGGIQDRKGAKSLNSGASVNLNWVVFDGLKMFAIKKRLNETEKLSDLQLKQKIETTIYDIIINYYTIVRIKKLQNAFIQNLNILEERAKLVKLRLEIGSDSKVDWLITQTDVNKAKSDILKTNQELDAAKLNLNIILARNPDTEFEVSDSIVVNYNPSIDEIRKQLPKNNSLVLIAQQNEIIWQQTIKEAQSSILPQIQINSAYTLIRNQSQAGFVLLNSQNGLNGGATLSWVLFNGNRNNKFIKEREIGLLNQRLITQENILRTDAMAYLHYKNLLANKQIQKLDEENLKNSTELVSISLERYKIGKANLLETKETQKIFEEAQTRLINTLFEAKKSETELLKANGLLLK